MTETASFLRCDAATATRIGEILGLDPAMMTDVKVTFGLEDVGVAQVELLLNHEQLMALAQLSRMESAGRTTDPFDD